MVSYLEAIVIQLGLRLLTKILE